MPDSKVSRAKQCLAVLPVCIRMDAISAHAVEEAMEVSQSLARRRHLPSQAKVRSTTYRRGSTSELLAASERLMISTVHGPMLARARRSLSPA